MSGRTRIRNGFARDDQNWCLFEYNTDVQVKVCGTEDGFGWNTPSNFFPSAAPSVVPSASPSGNPSLAPSTSSSPTFTLGLQSARTGVAALYNEIANAPGVFVTFNNDADNCSGEKTCTTQSVACSISSGSTSDITKFPVVSQFSGTVASAPSSCCQANSCVYSLVESKDYAVTAGQQIIIEYFARGGDDWYECALVLFKGSPPATTTKVAGTKIIRGSTIQNTRIETFTIPSDGNYFVGFFTGSYDRSGGTALGASLTIEAFRIR